MAWTRRWSPPVPPTAGATQVQLRETYDTDELNTYTVIAERNVLIGYEHLIAAAEVQP